MKSYRLRNGILHNPANDRRTTKGVFHIAEGGLPIPDDKLAVPAAVFARLLARALRPPAGDLPPAHTAWHLVGTVAEGTLCHKPCTVSGGGKSEISKAISDAILPGPVFVADFEPDMDRVAALIAHDCSRRFRDPLRNGSDLRPVLSPERSLGSVIKLLTPIANTPTNSTRGSAPSRSISGKSSLS